MRTSISIAICKLVTGLCKLVGPIIKKEGSVFPGSCALKWQPKVLEKIKYPRHVVVVTGSSGKGSTTAMLAHILEGSGKRVVWNKNGSNVRTAIATLVLNNSRVFSHELDADVLLLEMDERFITGTFKPGTISHMAITNVTRDQPSRNVHPEFIYEKIAESFDDDMTLVSNVDDPILNRARYTHAGKTITYGVGVTKVDSKSEPDYAVDGAYCPSCHSKLVYESYHYGHLGVYDCPVCSFGRGPVDYEATKVDLKKGCFQVAGHELKLNKKVFFAVYYTLLAYVLASAIGISEEDILREINEDEMDSKRGKSYMLGSRKIEMLESKNENALSYLQSIEYIVSQPGKKTVIMGFENVSRRYKYNDLSWLWDVEFEALNDKRIDRIFLIGRFRYDVAERLDYAGIDKDKVILVEDLASLLKMVEEKSQGDIYTMVCFDMTAIIKSLLEEENR